MSRAPRSTTLPATFEGMKADYSAAKLSRFRRVRTGIYSAGSSADYHYRSDADYLRIIEYARDMDRNDAVIGQMVDRAVLNTVQNGLVPDPQTGDVELNTALLKRFTSWAKDKLQCDLAGVLTFAAMQEQVLRAMLIDGDIFALPTDTGALELVESHRCRTPTNTTRNVVHGIMLDAHRRRLEFWFTKDDIDPNMSLSRVSDVQAYQAFDSEGWPAVFHVFNPKRVSQTRGVSALAPVFDVAGMFEDIQFAKLVQQQVVSCFAIIRQLSPDSTDVQSPRLGDQELDTYSDGVRKLVEQIAPGMELTGNPGETISGFSPQVPNPGAMEHFRLMLTLLGINLGLPLVMVTMDASDTNFSGWRGAVDQARMGFKRNQAWLIDNFLTPVYRWKVRQWTDPNSGDPRLIAAAKKLIQSGGDLYAHAWSTPKWPYIQPLQDAQADALRVEKRQISPRRQLAERGLDIDDIRVETIADNGDWIVDAINKAKQIEKETGVTVDWHELLYVPNVIDQKPGLPGSPTTTAEPQGTVNDA